MKNRTLRKAIAWMDANREEILGRLTRLAEVNDRILNTTSSRRQREKAARKHRLEVEIQMREEELQKINRQFKPVSDNQSDIGLKQVP